MKLNQDCTIIIVTHERHNLLINNIDYYFKFSNNIIILDSSKKKINVNKKIKYFHLPGQSLIKKIIYGLGKCKSDYVAISSDDDFYLTRSLNKGISFLKSNVDYISASGSFFSFELFKKFFFFKKMYNNSYKSFDHKTVSKRLKDATISHQQLFYSVFKKKILLRSFYSFKSFKNSLDYHEHVATLIPLLFGKHKNLNLTWMIRDGSVHKSFLTQNDKEDNLRTFEDKYLLYSKSYLAFTKNIDDINFKYNIFEKTKTLRILIKDYFKSRMVSNDKKLNIFDELKVYLRFLKYFKYLIFQIHKYNNFSKQDIIDIKNIEKKILNRKFTT